MLASYNLDVPVRTGGFAVASRVDLATAIFLVSAFFAPLEILLVGAFTVYDAATVGLAVVAAALGKRLRCLPFTFNMAIYVFLFFALLSTCRAAYPAESATQIVQFAFIFFVQLPVVLALATSPFMSRMVLAAFAAGALVGMIFALASGHLTGAGRTTVFYSENPNRLGYPTGYLLPFVLHFLFLSWRSRRFFWSTIVALPVLYVLAWSLAASGSRSAAASSVVGSLVFLTLRRRPERNAGTIIRSLFSVAVLGLLLFVFLQSEYFPSTLRQRTERTLMGESSLTQDRLDLAIGGWRAFVNSPFVGLGLDNFRYVANDYVFVPFGQLPHNLWIQFLSSVGIFGTLAVVVLMLAWFVFLYRAQRATADLSSRELICSFMASMCAILTQYLFLPVLIQRQYWLLYGLGLASAMYCLRSSKRASHVCPESGLCSQEARTPPSRISGATN